MQHWDCFMLKVIGYEMGKGKIRCTSKMGLLRRLFQLREIPHAGLNSNRMVRDSPGIMYAERQNTKKYPLHNLLLLSL